MLDMGRSVTLAHSTAMFESGLLIVQSHFDVTTMTFCMITPGGDDVPRAPGELAMANLTRSGEVGGLTGMVC